jgi:hypothetical protein
MPFKTLPLGKSGRVALVDADDYLRLSQFDWQLGRYVFRRYVIDGKQRQIALQREVLKRPQDRIRFINGDPLDCRKENLRLFDGGDVTRARHCPHCGGELSTSRRSSYIVRISVDGKRYSVGAWPSLRVAEHIRQIVAEMARGLRGRGLTAAKVQRQLDLATGRRE